MLCSYSKAMTSCQRLRKLFTGLWIERLRWMELVSLCVIDKEATYRLFPRHCQVQASME